MTATAPNEPSSARLSTTELRGLAAETMDWDATETRARLVAREVSALEVVEAAITRAELLDPQLGAIVHTRYDEARAAARSPGTGRFAGVPTFVKDLDDVRGLPTHSGSRSFGLEPATGQGPYVDALERAGLVFLGKSSTPEFGLTASTEPLLHGPTRNPWNPGHSPGGSSGGAAALVAARIVPIAHATDGGGSIRVPASCCGVFGLKPSRGRCVPLGRPIGPVDIAASLGFLPRRDILVDLAEDFAADVRVARGGVAHHALRRRDDRDAEAVAHQAF